MRSILLAATIKFHLQKEELPLALQISLNNIYVDNNYYIDWG